MAPYRAILIGPGALMRAPADGPSAPPPDDTLVIDGWPWRVIGLSVETEKIETTMFGDAARTFKCGLPTLRMQLVSDACPPWDGRKILGLRFAHVGILGGYHVRAEFSITDVYVTPRQTPSWEIHAISVGPFGAFVPGSDDVSQQDGLEQEPARPAPRAIALKKAL